MIPWTHLKMSQTCSSGSFPSLPILPNLKLIVYLPKMFSPAGVPSWSCCPAHCWHSTELRTTHKWLVYWPQVRYTHEHTETHLTMDLGYEVSREPAVNRRTRPNAADQLQVWLLLIDVASINRGNKIAVNCGPNFVRLFTNNGREWGRTIILRKRCWDRR